MVIAIILSVALLLILVFVAWFLGRYKRVNIDIDSEFKRNFLSGKLIRIDGIPFIIRKINVLDYLAGAKVLSETFSVYKNKDPQKIIEAFDQSNINQLKKYMTDVICEGCLKPKFVRDKASAKEGEVPIEDLFADWILAQRLSEEIFAYTHGKKN